MGYKRHEAGKFRYFWFIWQVSPGSFLEMMIWGGLNCAVSVACVWVTRQILSLVYSGYSTSMFEVLFIYGLLLMLSAGYSVWYKRYRVQFHVILDFERKIRLRLHKKSQQLSNETFEAAAANALIRMADGARQNLFRYMEIWISIAMAILQAIIVVSYVSTYHIWFLLLLPFSVIHPCLTLAYQSNLWKRYYHAIEQCKREETEYLKAMIDGVACKESRITYASVLLSRKWNKSRSYRDLMENEKSGKMFRLRILLMPLDLLGSSGGYLISVILLFLGKIDYASCTAAVAAYASLVSAFHSLAAMIGNEAQYRKMIQPFFEYWDYRERTGTARECTLRQSIRLEQVSFKYPGQNRNAVEDIDLTIRKGEVIAVVGENGAGKTTLTNLILGLFLPGSGTVYYDDKDISAIQESALHQKQSIVPQMFNRYKMTVEDNIAIGDFGKKDSLEIEQKRLAFLADAEIPLSTFLGKEFGGTELSGGQWQQLSCARGFYKDSDFLVLDEATSAIDPLKEKAVYDAFKRELKGKTGIIITHRLSGISLADRVIVLDHGHIVQSGTHSQLLEEDGLYRQLWNMQTRAFQ